MKSFLLWSVLIAFLVFTSMQSTYPQTIVPGGYVSGTWTAAGSPYLVQGNITIHTDSTLTIQPGVEVNFQGYYSFTVNGYLHAIGTVTDSIHFTASTNWGGLSFYNAPDSSHLAFCTISRGGNIFVGMGGILCTNSNPVITHCRISYNIARGGIPTIAGGIALNNSNAEISWCDINYNRCGMYGGGITINNSSPQITGCNIIANYTVERGGGIYIAGSSNPVITGCTIKNDTSNMDGGGITVTGGVVTISECTIGYNKADDGGGIWINGGSVFLDHCIIEHNICWTGPQRGGGIFAIGGSFTLDHCTLYGNILALNENGTEIYTGGNAAMIIENCIFINNLSYLIVFGSTSPASVLYNDFKLLYTSPPYYFFGNVPTGLAALTQINANGDSCDVYANIFLDPLFADPANGDYNLTWANWPTPDSTKSPCIDAGDPNFPLDPDNTISDMGAFYFHQPGSHIQPGYVSGIWFAANSPYFINGDITIHADSALNIEPGVEVIFNGHYKFNVEGIISAVGTENDSIYFTAADPDTGWWGLRFTNAADGSLLSYCNFQYGKATGGAIFWDNRGGAIFANSSSPQITHCTIRNNIALTQGGGIYVNGSSAGPFPQISYCSIVNNSALNSLGGGIYINAGSFHITDCIISGNTAGSTGGGLYIQSGATDTVNISNCIISDDSSSGYGGGIYVVDGYTFIDGCTITGNKARLTGGGLYSGGDLSLTNSTVQGNISWGGTVNYEIGGGGFIAYKNTFVHNCIIAGNISHTGSYPSYGGGFLLRQANYSAEITNSKILNNSADIAGGMMFTSNNVTLAYCEISNNQALLGVYGGAQIQSDNSSIDHCTVSGNVGGGLIVNNDADISNSIFSWNSPNALHISESTTITYSDFFANEHNLSTIIPPGFGVLDTTNINGDSCDVYYNIFLNPLFADTANGDFHLTENSPCIDAGDPTSPLDPDGTITDMGVFPFDQSIPVELVSFTAELIDDNVLLKWITATETNNSGFEIERKQYDSGWEEIGFVAGHGTTTEIQHYTFTDNDVNPGKYQYKLKQIDYDGTFEYSHIVEVEILFVNEFSLSQNFPNPFNPSTKIEYSIPQASQVRIKVFDILGNEIETIVNEEKTAGTYELTWYAENLPSGVYFYQLQAGQHTAVKKMLLLK
jgi:hypothetical protein